MELKTKRLNLDELSWSDLDQIHELHLLPEVDEFNTTGIPANIGVTEALLKVWLETQLASPRMSYIFCMRLRETGQFLGLIAMNIGKPGYKSAEVWYRIHPRNWRKGYTTEALKELLRFSFTDLALHRITAGCATENIASIGVLEKSGMTREGMHRKILPIRGQWVDNYSYAILETDFSDGYEKRN
jgi:RimJ/RimL family protein N-acetyltransferase